MSSIDSPRRFDAPKSDGLGSQARELLREAHLREVLHQIRRHKLELEKLRDAKDYERLSQEREVGRYLLVSLIRRQSEERRDLEASIEIARRA